MKDQILSISLCEDSGRDLWENENIPWPNNICEGVAVYTGQKNIENLMKTINQLVYRENDEKMLPYLFHIFEKSLEQGVEDEAIVQWDDRYHYTRISWTGYSWKLPPEMKRRKVKVKISTLEDDSRIEEFSISLKKIADRGGDIQIAPRIVSRMNLKNGHRVKIKMGFKDQN